MTLFNGGRNPHSKSTLIFLGRYEDGIFRLDLKTIGKRAVPLSTRLTFLALLFLQIICIQPLRDVRDSSVLDDGPNLDLFHQTPINTQSAGLSLRHDS